MSKMGVILDFQTKSITIDQISLKMKDLKAISDSKSLNNLIKETLEPSSMREATNRVVEILDAMYKKANLAKVVHDHCGHLSSSQQCKLLRLLV
ncbi:MAG: hypothetical protein GY874_13520 [Desulfobacteraceae bacterium]|nr:hypothetical protein [Desulfobacteraceae bacterium]